jgi:WD40 repeat protein
MRLFSGGTDGTVRIWDLDDLENPRVLNAAATSLAVSPNGRDLATANSQTARLWDLDTGVEKASFEIVAGSIHSIAFDPAGDTLAAGVDRGVKAADEIMVWDLASLRPRTAIKGALRQFHSLTFAPNGRTLAGVGGGDEREPGKLVLWDATTWQRPTHLVGNAALVALTPDGDTLISAGAVTSTTFESTMQKLAEGSGRGWDFGKVVLSTLGTAITGSPGRCTLWNLDRGKRRTAFATDAAQVTALAMSADGRTVACAGVTSGVKVWDVATATEQASIPWSGTAPSLAFSPDGKTLALGGLVWGDSIGFALTQGWQASQGRLPGEVQLWNFEEHRKLGVFKGHRELVTALGFSPDGSLLATGSGKLEMTVADDTTGQIKVWDVGRGQELLTLEGHPTAITCVAFSPDGKTLASASGSLRQSLLAPGEVRLWDLETRQTKSVIGGFTGGVQCLAFSPDGQTLATGSSGLAGEVKLWQVATAQGLLSFKVSVQEVFSLSFSSNGRTLAAGTLHGPIMLWHAPAFDQELE